MRAGTKTGGNKRRCYVSSYQIKKSLPPSKADIALYVEPIYCRWKKFGVQVFKLTRQRSTLNAEAEVPSQHSKGLDLHPKP
jgi:hypothetical protein